MSEPLLLLAYAAGAGGVLPLLLARARWTHRAPVLGVGLWLSLGISVVAALLLALAHVVPHLGHLRGGLEGLEGRGGLGGLGGLGLLLGFAVPALVLARFAAAVVRSALVGARAHRRHVRMLDLVGRRDGRLDATVLDHPQPAAYCLPGRRARVVVSSGALAALTAEELGAVLTHERTHLVARHHLATGLARALAAAMPRVPLGRHIGEHVALLVEMHADDRAARRHGRRVVAAAMVLLAGAGAPASALAAGGPSTIVRVRRMLAPERPLHPAVRLTASTGAAAAPVLPFAFTCVPVAVLAIDLCCR